MFVLCCFLKKYYCRGRSGFFLELFSEILSKVSFLFQKLEFLNIFFEKFWKKSENLENYGCFFVFFLLF